MHVFLCNHGSIVVISGNDGDYTTGTENVTFTVTGTDAFGATVEEEIKLIDEGLVIIYSKIKITTHFPKTRILETLHQLYKEYKFTPFKFLFK